MSLHAGGGHALSKARPKRIFLALTLFTALFLAAYYINSRPPKHDYVLVIDAGSSGTRMYAYMWERSKSPDDIPRLELLPPEAAPHKVPRRAMPNRRAYKRVETEPGLDAFVGDVKGLETKALRPLLEWAAEAVPHTAWSRTPVFLLGTAGLRRLSPSDQLHILNNARMILSKSGLRFMPSWARVLSGSDEGLFGWIALNLSAGKLRRTGVRDTLGMLDLGGSSLEVAFHSENLVTSGVPHLNVSLLGGSQPLFSRTHHRYGLNDAYDRAITYLLLQQKQHTIGNAAAAHATENVKEGDVVGGSVENAEEGIKVTAAAVTTGATAKDTEAATSIHTKGIKEAINDNADTATLLQQQEQQQQGGSGTNENQPQQGRRKLTAEQQQLPQVLHPCLHDGFTQHYTRSHPITDLPHITELTLVGKPDYEACRQLAEKIVNATTLCPTPTFSNTHHDCVLGAPQPKFPGSFVALTGFYVVHKFYKLQPKGGFGNLHDVGRQFCHMPWNQVTTKFSEEFAVEQYCFRAPYVHALLQHGLNLQPDQVDVGSGDAGWTLGAAVSEGSRLAGIGVHDSSSTSSSSSGGLQGGISSTRASSMFEYWRGMNIVAGVLLMCVAILGYIIAYTVQRQRGKSTSWGLGFRGSSSSSSGREGTTTTTAGHDWLPTLTSVSSAMSITFSGGGIGSIANSMGGGGGGLGGAMKNSSDGLAHMVGGGIGGGGGAAIGGAGNNNNIATAYATPYIGGGGVLPAPATVAYDKKHTPATQRTVGLTGGVGGVVGDSIGGATLLQSSRTQSRTQLFSRQRLTTSFAESGGGDTQM